MTKYPGELLKTTTSAAWEYMTKIHSSHWKEMKSHWSKKDQGRHLYLSVAKYQPETITEVTAYPNIQSPAVRWFNTHCTSYWTISISSTQLHPQMKTGRWCWNLWNKLAVIDLFIFYPWLFPSSKVKCKLWDFFSTFDWNHKLSYHTWSL